MSELNEDPATTPSQTQKTPRSSFSPAASMSSSARHTGDEPQHEEEEEEDEYLLSCQCESSRVISTLLRCLVMDKGRHQAGLNNTTNTSASTSLSYSGTAAAAASNNKKLLPVTVVCHPTSLTFHVQGAAHTSHASVDLQAGLFADYRVSNNKDGTHQPPSFCVNLTTVLECLHVLGTHHLDRCKVGLAYNATQEVLHMELLLDDAGGAALLSKAAIPGLYAAHDHTNNIASLATAFRSTPVAARLLVQSDVLKDALQELECYNVNDTSTRCTVAISPDTGLELAVVGHACEVVLSLLPPPSSADVIPDDHGSASCLLFLECNSPQARTYPLYALWLGMRALESAQETCISINQDGMIAIQHQVVPIDDIGDGSPSFVDFLLLPLLDDDDDDEGGKGARNNNTTIHQGRGRASSQPESTTDLEMNGERAGNLYKSNSSSGGSDSEEEQERPLSAAPLFGTVVPDGRQTIAATHDRAVRPRRRRLVPAPTADDDDEENEDNHVVFGSHGDGASSDDDEPLDVAESTRTRRIRSRDDDDDPPSSPELVYGED